MVKLLDKEDWMVRVYDYPRILENESYYTQVLNTLGNDRSKPHGFWYEPIGKEILKSLEGRKKIPFPFDIIIKDGDTESVPKDRLFSIFSFFICCLNKPTMSKFGLPLYHSYFGEGFEDPKLKKFEHASYFLEVNGIPTKIGYDQRGSSLYFDEKATPEQVCMATIELVKYLL
jgi:hypothetical protein